MVAPTWSLTGRSGLRRRSDDFSIMHLESIPVKPMSQHLEECRHRERLATRAASGSIVVGSIRFVAAFCSQLDSG